MGGQTISTSETRIEALQLQSSAYGVVVPVVYGLTRIAGNLIWYGGFKAIPHTTTQGGKGGVKTQNTSYTYQASVMMGLCHGPLVAVRRVWRGKKSYASATPLQTLGLTLRTGAIAQAIWTYLSTSFPAQAIGYSGLAHVDGQDYDLGTAAQVENHNFEVEAPLAYGVQAGLPDADPKEILADLMGNARYGAGFSLVAANAAWSDYCVSGNLLMSPAITEQTRAAELVARLAQLTNSEAVWSDSSLEMIPYGDQAQTAYGRTYTPNNAPAYDLSDDFFLSNGAEPPVRVERKQPADAKNHIRVEFRNRAREYNLEIAEAKDQADIDTTGLRSAEVVQAHWICDAQVARNVAQHLLQRSLYVRATYSFRLPINFVMLKQMDLLRLTDSALQLNQTPVRITSIEEEGGSDVELLVTAEEFPSGVATATQYPSEIGAGYSHDYNVAPGSVQTPVIFEMPGELAASGLEVGVAARGTGASWGGCRVWVSMDGTNYREVGTIYGGSRYGALTGPVAGGVLPVSIYGGQLVSGSAGDAAALNTLCYVGGSAPEFLAYQTATLTGAQAYNLSGLVRGAYQSNGASAHLLGDPFVRVDESVAKSGAIDRGYIGRTIQIKCTSFNIYGGAEQSLADATAYPYTVTGRMFGRGKLFRVVAVGGADTQAPTGPGLTDGETGATLANIGRSYTLVVLVRSTGAIASVERYDVYGEGASEGGRKASHLAAALNTLTSAHIAVVISHDEPQGHRFDDGLATAMYRCGASRGVFGSPQFQFRSAYVLIGIGGCGEGNGFEAYQGAVGGDPNAWVDVTFQLKNGNLIVTGAGATPRSLADYSYTGSLNATSDAVLVGSGYGYVVNGNEFIKDGGAPTNWEDGSAYAPVGFSGGCFVACEIGRDNQVAMIGLSINPGIARNGSSTHHGYQTLDFAWYTSQSPASGEWQLFIYEGGLDRGAHGTYHAGDHLALTYDGFNVRYLRNGMVWRVVRYDAPGPLYLDSSLCSPLSGFKKIRFGPMPGVRDIGTGQIQPGAAAVPQVITGSSGTVGCGELGINSVFHVDILSLSWTNDTSAAVDMQAEFAVVAQKSGSGSGANQANFSWAVTGGGASGNLSSAPTIASQEASYSHALQIPVAAGQTITVKLRARMSSANMTSHSFAWRDAVARLTALKR